MALEKSPLEAELDDLIDSLRNQPKKPPSACLYHYTSFDAFVAILKSQCFWMTDYRYLNDLSEARYAASVVDHCLDGFSDDSVWAELREYMTTYRAMAAHRSFFMCVLCLSEELDSLYEWRAYGGNGDGICMGITPPEKYIRNLTRLIYDEREQEEFAKEWLSRFFAGCHKHQGDPLNKQAIAFKLFKLIMGIRTRFKHSAYRVEKEWRYTNMPGDRFMNTRQLPRGDVPYFVEDQIRNDQGLVPILEICIGPTRDEITAELRIRSLLRELRYPNAEQIMIWGSEIPYRA